MCTQLRITMFAVLCVASLSVLALAAGNPAVTTTYPSQNALNISAGSSITVTFDTDINPATLDPVSFVVNSRFQGGVDGSLAYDEVTRTATFTPTDDFCTGDQVVVQLSTGIQSTEGAPLSQSYNWAFTVNVIDGTESVKLGDQYSTTSTPYWPVAADLNGDGFPDVACIQSTGPNTSELMIYLNNGDGSLSSGIAYPSVTEEMGIVAADLDKDGDIDLASAERIEGNVSVRLNNGDGTFGSSEIFSIGTQPLSACAADFDGDGDLDLAVTYSGYLEVGIMVNDGAGNFAMTSTLVTVGSSYDILSADLNNDGFADIVTANDGWDCGSISVLINQGDGSFYPSNEYSLAGNFDFFYGDMISSADFDADGDVDITVAMSEGDYVGVLLNDGNGSFPSEIAIACEGTPVAIHTADLVADGNMDILVSSLSSPYFSILAGNGDGTFSEINYPESVTSDARHSFSVADFNTDGRLDLFLPNYKNDNIQVLLNGYVCGDVNYDGAPNVGDVVHLIGYVFKDGASPYPLRGGDVNTDGEVNTGDPVYLINYIFKYGPAPVCEE